MSYRPTSGYLNGSWDSLPTFHETILSAIECIYWADD